MKAMQVAESYICLNNIRIYAYHGVMEQERRVGGRYRVSLRVGCDVSRAMTTDNVHDTINYAELYKLVEREMLQPSALIEHVAGRIAQAVCREFPAATTVDVTVSKINPPMKGDVGEACVELHVTNQHQNTED